MDKNLNGFVQGLGTHVNISMLLDEIHNTKKNDQ